LLCLQQPAQTGHRAEAVEIAKRGDELIGTPGPEHGAIRSSALASTSFASIGLRAVPRTTLVICGGRIGRDPRIPCQQGK
jgi:hypothetical protein